MSKTLDLRELITAQLRTVSGGTYHQTAPHDAAYPYKVYTFERIGLTDLTRDDLDLCIDVWDRGADSKAADEIADRIEDLFNAANLPQTTILPTFFRDSRYPVEDILASLGGKLLKHIRLHFTVQTYAIPTTT